MIPLTVLLLLRSLKYILCRRQLEIFVYAMYLYSCNNRRLLDGDSFCVVFCFSLSFLCCGRLFNSHTDRNCYTFHKHVDVKVHFSVSGALVLSYTGATLVLFEPVANISTTSTCDTTPSSLCLFFLWHHFFCWL